MSLGKKSSKGGDIIAIVSEEAEETGTREEPIPEDKELESTFTNQDQVQYHPMEKLDQFGSSYGRSSGSGQFGSTTGPRTGRRSTIFTIGENYEFEADDEFQRKLSCLSAYSSNSSLGMSSETGIRDAGLLFAVWLQKEKSVPVVVETVCSILDSNSSNPTLILPESETGETWRSRTSRRVSLIPSSMGLQPWVKGSALTSSPSQAGAGGHHLRKKRKYEDIKNLVKNGKLSEAKGAVRDGDWGFSEDIRTRLWPFLDSIHESSSTGGDYWETVKEIFGHERNGSDQIY